MSLDGGGFCNDTRAAMDSEADPILGRMWAHLVTIMKRFSDNCPPFTDNPSVADGQCFLLQKLRVLKSCVHCRSRMAIDPRAPTMPGQSTFGLHQLGRHCLHQARRTVGCRAADLSRKIFSWKASDFGQRVYG